jgi:hypothetical protein
MNCQHLYTVKPAVICLIILFQPFSIEYTVKPAHVDTSIKQSPVLKGHFLAHLAKGNVSFCHHLAFVIHLLFTF